MSMAVAHTWEMQACLRSAVQVLLRMQQGWLASCRAGGRCRSAQPAWATPSGAPAAAWARGRWATPQTWPPRAGRLPGAPAMTGCVGRSPDSRCGVRSTGGRACNRFHALTGSATGGQLRTVGYNPLQLCTSVMRESRFSGDAALRACAQNKDIPLNPKCLMGCEAIPTKGRT